MKVSYLSRQALLSCRDRETVSESLLTALRSLAIAKGATKKDFDEMRELQFRICEGEKIVVKWGVVGM